VVWLFMDPSSPLLGKERGGDEPSLRGGEGGGVQSLGASPEEKGE